ncbi:MAG: hypothetical protein JHC33_07990 [Ignisphaera sp.]|nr:hypothetical protein [Ignisphaera sp.]
MYYTPFTLRATDVNNEPAIGGYLYTTTSTGVPKATYTDASGSYLSENPIRLDYTGSATVYGVEGDIVYITVTDCLGNHLYNYPTFVGFPSMTHTTPTFPAPIYIPPTIIQPPGTGVTFSLMSAIAHYPFQLSPAPGSTEWINDATRLAGGQTGTLNIGVADNGYPASSVTYSFKLFSPNVTYVAHPGAIPHVYSISTEGTMTVEGWYQIEVAADLVNPSTFSNGGTTINVNIYNGS